MNSMVHLRVLGEIPPTTPTRRARATGGPAESEEPCDRGEIRVSELHRDTRTANWMNMRIETPAGFHE